MTRGSTLGGTRRIGVAETGSESRSESTAKVPGRSDSSRKMSNRAEDRLNDVVADENFRRRVEIIFDGLAEMPKDWDVWTVREQRDWMYAQCGNLYKNLPKSLTFLCVGSALIDDCERPECEARPEWLDHEKFLRGQRFAMDNMAGIFFAQLLSLYALFSFENGLKPLVLTGKSSDPFTAFQRYLSTGVKVKNWYSSDVWSKDTVGYRDLQTVRKMHAVVRQRLFDSSLEDIDEASKIHDSWSPARATLLQDIRNSCPAPLSGQCPFAYTENDKFKRPKGMNQGEMSATQCGFVGLVILYPERFGIHRSTDDDLDAFCHLWRSLGYLLGIEDEFNFCSGSLEEVKERSRDFLEYWVKPNLREITPEWEHMLRCVTEGIQYYFPSASYEHGLLYLSELLEMPMPKLRSSMSYFSWIRYLLMKKTFNWTAKFDGVPALMNRRLIKSIDRAVNFTEEQLKVLRDKSNETLSKGIAETNAARSSNDLVTSTYWHKVPFLVFLSTCFLFKCPAILKELVKKFFRIDKSLNY
ncbi:uncharacterized protein [Venturia canescens]|nr:uncharacterized protein LOC122405871 isoform X2 [Venturia canescens]XP_043266853.1 uncharacterized protein LOC122405871 isoform X2 [Venturia canescens]XP_043266854.1 uncharacterized protein LOC122405871 isoform X2 [Venturia canescens]XP_043266855.1 uncharacterized protein LOC122405871 isoform X2 [Venturia canescens]XP_043266856.1 uncharacterized protein LOC122405871 isoform X2 [Venturia canescens]XP_043266857.1 uncharacterized protein LOC122405871 isoform X2 [Venturia canescens]